MLILPKRYNRRNGPHAIQSGYFRANCLPPRRAHGACAGILHTENYCPARRCSIQALIFAVSRCSIRCRFAEKWAYISRSFFDQVLASR